MPNSFFLSFLRPLYYYWAYSNSKSNVFLILFEAEVDVGAKFATGSWEIVRSTILFPLALEPTPEIYWLS